MSSNAARNEFGPVRLVKSEGDYSENTNQEMRLKELYKRLNKVESLKVGQLVKWKTGLHNRKRPYPEEPAIVTQLLEATINDPTEVDSGSQFFREPLNVVIGIWDDGDFNELYVDRRRLEAY